MAKDTKSAAPNEIDERAIWLRNAADALRADFDKSGLPLPDRIRYGFSTKGSGTSKTGECWHSPASADGAYEIFIRADQENPLEILGILVRELVHAALPVEDSHGKKFKAAALKVGLTGKMRSAIPNHLLEARLRLLLDHLGPLPHRALDISWSPFDKPKRQTHRMLKAICAGGNNDQGEFQECGYMVRLSSKWANDYGATCPRHGKMSIEFPSNDDLSDNDTDTADSDGPQSCFAQETVN